MEAVPRYLGCNQPWWHGTVGATGNLEEHLSDGLELFPVRRPNMSTQVRFRGLTTIQSWTSFWPRTVWTWPLTRPIWNGSSWKPRPWGMKWSYDCCPESYVELSYLVWLKRRTREYGSTMLFLCVVLSLLTLFNFLLPSQSHNRHLLGECFACVGIRTT